MRLLPFLLLIFSCATWGQSTKNPSRLPECDGNMDRKFYTNSVNIPSWTNCWGEIVFNDYGDPVYQGEWKNGRPFGVGTYKFPANRWVMEEKIFAGTITAISNGGVSGKIKLFVSKKISYEGEMKNGDREGFGTFYHPNGNRYRGYWLNDSPHGEGIFTYADGREPEEGYFKKGVFVEAAKVNFAKDDRGNVNQNRQQLPEERRRAEEDSHRQEQQAAIERDRQKIEEERRRLAEEKRQLEQAKNNNLNKQPAFTDSRRRLALVIGNAAYKNSPLRNPINDADLISNALSGSGFIVSRYDNLTYAKMREVVRAFGEKLNRGDVGLFYFSGHAVQYRGKNYLLPINEDLKHSDEIPSSALDVDFVLAKMETAKNDLNIVILDSCRNNPLGAESRNIDRGLTMINAAKGTFIAFATSPGNVALDGSGSNSPYTKNLAQAIRKGGLTLEQVFKETRRNVISETNSQQVPWENSSILGDFYFR